MGEVEGDEGEWCLRGVAGGFGSADWDAKVSGCLRTTLA